MNVASLYSAISNASYIQAIADQTRPWIQYSILVQAVNSWKTANSATQAGRQLILDTINTLGAGAQPYQIADAGTNLADIRFGTQTNAGTVAPNVVYVALFRNGWEQVITQLRQSAQFNDRTSEKGINNGAPPTMMGTPDDQRSQFQDAVTSINKAIQTAGTLLSTCTGVYNYHSFEQAWGLIWSVATQPPPFKDADRLHSQLAYLAELPIESFHVGVKLLTHEFTKAGLLPHLLQLVIDRTAPAKEKSC